MSLLCRAAQLPEYLICIRACSLARFHSKLMGWSLGRGLALPQENIMNLVGNVCCNSCEALLTELQGTCETRLCTSVPWMMMMIVLIAASKRQIPIRCTGHITGDVTREVKSSLEKKNITE